MCSNRRESRPRTRWSLRARLLTGQALLLVAVVVGIGVASEIGLQRLVVDQLDTQVMDMQNRSLLELGGGPRLGPPPEETASPAASASSVPSAAGPSPTAPHMPSSSAHPAPAAPRPGRRDPRPGGPGDHAAHPGDPANGPGSPGDGAQSPTDAPVVPGQQLGGSDPGSGGVPGHSGQGGGGASTHSAQVSPTPDPALVGPGPSPAFLGRGGIAPGALGAIIDHGTVVAAGRMGFDGTENDLSDRAGGQLASLAVVGHPATVTVDGAGKYRVMADQTWRGTIVVSGLPMAAVDATLMRGLLISGGITVAALIISITVGVLVIRRALSPLDRVAGTAARVADLRLDHGEVALPVRVPAADAASNTEVGQLGSAVNKMLDHIANALSARHASETRARQFLADASHELRTPLAAIRGYAELAQRNRSAVPAFIGTAMVRLDAAARRMSDLVEDMLLLAQLDAGRPLEREPVDLSRLTVDAIADAHIADPGKAWDLDLPDDPVVIHGDGVRLHQVLANLLANARVHTPPGTTVTVSLEVDDRAGAVWHVCDDGPGIPGDLQPEIFERFTRGDSSRSRHDRGGGAGVRVDTASTGLGLSIVAAVVKAHDGTITLDSIPGCTAFTVRFPVGEGEPGPPDDAGAQRNSAESAQRL